MARMRARELCGVVVGTFCMRMQSIWDEKWLAGRKDATFDQIDRRSDLSYDAFVEEYVKRKRPVIITDATKGWSAPTKWNFEYFKQKFGDVVLPKKSMLVRDMIDEMLRSTPERPSSYAFSMSIPKLFPELLQDIEPTPDYWQPNWLDSPALLPGVPDHKLHHITGLEVNIGGAYSTFPVIHYDDLWTQTFVTQVHGRKEWVLYPPDHTAYLYPERRGANFSILPAVDGAIDLDKFPLFEHVKPLRFCIEPGEMFYNTPGWWHTTRALTPSIAVILSTASAPVWSKMTQEVFMAALREHKWYKAPIAALYYASYMTGFRVAQSVKESISR